MVGHSQRLSLLQDLGTELQDFFLAASNKWAAKPPQRFVQAISPVPVKEQVVMPFKGWRWR
jgi:hypothetical protein